MWGNGFLTVYEAQQAFYPFASQMPTLPVNITLIGYGGDDGSSNQTQQISTGPVTSLSGSVVQHRADTTGGSSGSAVLNSATMEIFGVHTNAGCTSTGGANSGNLYVLEPAECCDVAGYWRLSRH